MINPEYLRSVNSEKSQKITRYEVFREIINVLIAREMTGIETDRDYSMTRINELQNMRRDINPFDMDILDAAESHLADTYGVYGKVNG